MPGPSAFLRPACPSPRRFPSRSRPVAFSLSFLLILLALGATELHAQPQLWRKISDSVNADGDVAPVTGGNFPRLSPDSRRVVYQYDAFTDDAFELYSAPLDGSSLPVRLSAPLAPGQIASQWRITPDSDRVLYLSPDLSDQRELFLAPIAQQGASTRLNDPLEPFVGIVQFQVSPSADLAVYAPESGNLRLVDLDAGTDDLLSSESGIEEFRIDPSGHRVVYRASGGVFEQIGIGGGPTTNLDPNGGSVESDWKLTPSGDRVLYRKSLATRLRLFSTPIGGGSAVELSGNIMGLGVDSFRIGPDGERAVYLADQQVPGEDVLYSVPVAGGTTEPLFPADGDRRVDSYAIDPTGTRVVFRREDTPGVEQLYSVPIGGGAVVRLSAPLRSISGGIPVVRSFQITPDGTSVLYAADQGIENLTQIFRAPIDQAGMSELVASTNDGTSGPLWKLSPDGARVVALTRRTGLHARPHIFPSDGSDPSGLEVVDDGEFPSGGSARDLYFAPNGDFVYVADQEVAGRYELYAVTFGIFSDGFESGDVAAWTSSTP